MRALRWIAGSLAAGLVLALVATAWLAGTASGARFALKIARGRIPGDLAVGRVEGSLVGPLVLADVRYAAPAGGATVHVARIEADVAARDLLRRRIRLVRAAIDGVTVTLPESAPARPGPPRIPLPPADLTVPQPRWPVFLDGLALSALRVERAGTPPFEVDSAAAAGRWTAEELLLERLVVRSPQGEAEARARLAGAPAHIEAAGKVRWEVGASVYAGTLDARTEGERVRVLARLDAPFAAVARAELAQGAAPGWTLDLDAPEFDPRGLLLRAESPLARLAVALRAEGGAERARLTGDLTLNGERIRLDALELALAPDAVRIAELVARINGSPGLVRAEGFVRLAGEGPTVDLNLTADDLVLPPAWTGRALHARGVLRVQGHPDAYEAEGALAVGPPGRPSELEFTVRGTRAGVRLEPLQLRQPDGRLVAQGEIGFTPLHWQVDATAENFNPGEFAPSWPGLLDGRIRSRGEIRPDGPHAEVAIERLTGRLRDLPVTGEGELTYTPADWLRGEFHLESGDTRVFVRTLHGETPEARVELAVPALEAWLPGLAGAVHAEFNLRGQWPEVGISGRASGERLAYGDFAAEGIELSVEVANLRRPAGRVRAVVSGGAAGPLRFENLQLEGSGDEAAHELALAAEGRPLRGRFKTGGALAGGRWSGSVDELRLGWADRPELALEAPVSVAAARDGTVEIARSTLVAGAMKVRFAGRRSAAGEIEAEAGVDGAPLALIDDFAPGALPVGLDGLVQADAKARRTGAGLWSAQATIRSASAHAVLREEVRSKQDEPRRILVYEGLEIDAALEGGRAHAKLAAGLAARGRMTADVAATDLAAPSPWIEGKIEATLPTLEPLAVLAPQVPRLDGRIEARVEIGGSVAAPEIRGQIEASAMKADLPRLGLELREGTLRIAPSAGRELRISGAVRSGEGGATIDGSWTPGGAARIALKGDRFLAAGLPAARVVVTPDLDIAFDRAGLGIKGKARVVEAAVNLQKVPQGKARGHSPDVVVVDRQEEAEERHGLPLMAEVAVELGDNVQVAGFGLEAKLSGRLTVIERPGTPTTAAGEVLIAGTYQGYGQDLKITRGRVLYAGTPIADPRLDITAERELDEVTAGLRITGTAQNPEVSVYSRPEMGQADALAYLVTGKPLAGVSSQGETDLLDSAARSLGTAAGSLVAERIGRRLGIDEVGIEKSDMIEGGVFTIGQYLSPRLYVAYGVGLFEPGDLVTLRYELSKTLNLRAVRGPNETRAGVDYKIER